MSAAVTSARRASRRTSRASIRRQIATNARRAPDVGVPPPGVVRPSTECADPLVRASEGVVTLSGVAVYAASPTRLLVRCVAVLAEPASDRRQSACARTLIRARTTFRPAFVFVIQRNHVGRRWSAWRHREEKTRPQHPCSVRTRSAATFPRSLECNQWMSGCPLSTDRAARSIDGRRDAMRDYMLHHNANTHWSYPDERRDRRDSGGRGGTPRRLSTARHARCRLART